MTLDPRRKLEPQDAVDYITAVEDQLREVPHYWVQFLSSLEKYRTQQADVMTTIETVVDILHPFPHLLEGYNAFLPLPYGPDLWPLLPPEEPAMSEGLLAMLALIKDVEEYYVDRPEVYYAMVKAIQPRPENPRDKYQVIKEIEDIIHDAPPEFMHRFKKMMDVETFVQANDRATGTGR
ncbi:hypothetical protein DFP72DRAFT_880807 [Ephemerocybe angulata]|uniref:Uncharacterized protein n=1 Tax=Ephemerocybe angulata TaxID=980116 RepID=A0A8H6I9E3_9AGAR|nr:hypothetical protein DFP72DRAFT_880807 [Tulosesus angulatus]